MRPSTKPRRIPIYAIVRTGGKQYRVEADQVLDINRIQAEVGSTVELKDVLLLGGAGDVRVGTPVVDGALVVAEVIEHGRDKKILVFKYKNKTRYRRRYGHRQDFTRLAIKQIVSDGQVLEAAEKPKRPARKKPAARAKEPAPDAVETSVVEAAATETEAAPKPRRARVATPKAETPAVPEAGPAKAAPKPRGARAAKPKSTAKAATDETPEGE